MIAPPLPDRIASRIDIGDCWLWTGALSVDGYGRVRSHDRIVVVHRLVYETLVGPVPVGRDLDHLCRTRACCNPDHLDPVTRSENMRRSPAGHRTSIRKRSVTHCRHGHEFTPENTYVHRGKRQCRTCHRLVVHRSRQR